MDRLKFDSVFFNCPVRVPGSRTSVRLALSTEGYSFEQTETGVLVQRGGGALWVPNTSIEYAVVAADKAKKTKE